MKKIRIVFLFVAFLAVGAAFSSCGDSATKTEEQGKEYTSAYICPMHCEGSGSDKEGKCPTCGMDYVKNEKHESKGHSEDHEGHDH